jgi:hypothetical protein
MAPDQKAKLLFGDDRTLYVKATEAPTKKKKKKHL